MSEKIDVLISGLGPAGALIAKELVNLLGGDGNYSILAVERKEEPGVPVYCGEYMPTENEMKNLMPEVEDSSVFRIDDKYIHARTRRIVFVDPKGREKAANFNGFSFDRANWLKDTVQEAVKKGVTIWTGTSLVAYDFKKNLVKIRRNGGIKTISPRILVCADGIRSIPARESGLMMSTGKPLDRVLTTGYQTVSNLRSDPKDVYMYFGNRYSPGAYAWIIPKGDGTANIGTGTRFKFIKMTGKTLSGVMDNLFTHPHAKKYLENAKVTNRMGKPVPVGLPPDNLVIRNVVGIGDAVNQVISAVGAGIPPIMASANLLSIAIVKSLSGNGSLKEYEMNATKYVNPAIIRSWKLRRIFDRISQPESRFLKYFSLLSENDITSVTIARLNMKLRLLMPLIPLGNVLIR